MSPCFRRDQRRGRAGALRVKVAQLATQLTGGKVGEGQPKPTQQIPATGNVLTPENSFRSLPRPKSFSTASPAPPSRLCAGLRPQLVRRLMPSFSPISRRVPPESSTGEAATLQGICNDVILVLLARSTTTSRLAIPIVRPDHARQMTISAMAAGINSMTPLAARRPEMPDLWSRYALPAATISLIDAKGLLVASTPIQIRVSEQAALELLTNPTNAIAERDGRRR